MKTPVMCSLIAFAAMGTGIGLGWLFWGERTETRTPGRISRLSPPVSARLPGQRAAEPAQHAREQTALTVAADLENMKSMPVEEFAIHMADAWLSQSDSPGTLLRRALYLSACDADRGLAFWREYTRRTGQKFENTVLGDFFSVVASRDGKRFAEKLIEASPGGVVVLNSVMHGWAVSAPEEAVEWFNALPADSPNYHGALEGMLWGLAENSPARALSIYEQLNAADQNDRNAGNVASSTLINHGMKGLSELVAGVKDEAEKQLLLTSAMRKATNEPPGEFVKWMAGPLESAPYLQKNFEQMASRWATSAPDEAMAWLQQNALRSGQDTALSLVAASLARHGKGDDLATWLTANPHAPGQAAIVSGKTGAPVP